ncbi:unnamed protein product [Sympodiomycopsis kandeliae]
MPAAPKTSQLLNSSKVVIIGGSSGIGFGVASALIEEGAEVIIASSNQSKVDDAVKRLSDPELQFNADPKRVKGLTVNLKGPQMEESLGQLFEKIGKFDHLIHTAGDKLAVAPIQDVSYNDMVSAGDVRFFSAILAVKKSLPYVQKSIILTTGSISIHPIPNWTVVSGYAGGLSSLTRQLAYDLKGLRVNLVSPGAVDTELWDDLPKEAKDGLMKGAAKNSLTDKVPKASDVAQTYLGLLKDTNVTAQTVYTDGGSLYGPRPE